jgi:hypothetical protein
MVYVKFDCVAVCTGFGLMFDEFGACGVAWYCCLGYYCFDVNCFLVFGLMVSLD